MEVRIPRPRFAQFSQGSFSKKRLIAIIVVIVIVLGVLIWVNWPIKHYPGLQMSPKSDVVDNVINEPSDSIFANTIKHVGYDTFLHGKGPFTIFAPVDAAYNNLPSESRDFFADKENVGSLRQVMLFHIVKGKYTFADLKDGMRLKTLAGEDLTVQRKGQYLILNGNSYIKTYDIVSSNGVVHLVTNFLIPDTMLN